MAPPLPFDVECPPAEVMTQCGASLDPSVNTDLGRPEYSGGTGTIFEGYTDCVFEKNDYGESPDPNTATIKQIIVRTWKYRNCDDPVVSSTCEQLIKVVDQTAPELTSPSDAYVECDKYNPHLTHPDYTGYATATDACSEPVVTWTDSETVSGKECPVLYYFDRMWKAVDDCGNVSTHTQRIYVQDTTPPVFDNCPEDMCLNICDEIPPPANVTATDRCVLDENVTIVFSEEILPGNEPLVKQIIRRTWTATDTCGNSRTCTQDIIIKIPNSIDYWSSILRKEC